MTTRKNTQPLGIMLPVAFVFLGTSLVAQPRFQPIPEQMLLAGSPLHLALDGSGSDELTYAVTSSSDLVTARILEGNRSLRIKVDGFGVMVFELFDRRARRATNRVVELANGGFYDGLVFHRVVNEFVIQGGDPKGDGTGGSELGAFNDQFHVDLQHNRTGLLSMAKANDDTNNSQFFITEGTARHLDFNHSIFGLIVEGDNVREAISNVEVDELDRPQVPIIMSTVESFRDRQNAVLMLKAGEGLSGAVDITVSVSNASGAGTERTFRVNVVPDTVNSPPFLADVPEMRTSVDEPFGFQLKAVDVEGEPSFYLDQTSLAANDLPVPVFASPGLTYVVDFDTGAVQVTPTNGLTGRHFIVVATAVDTGAVDYQAVPVFIEPQAIR